MEALLKMQTYSSFESIQVFRITLIRSGFQFSSFDNIFCGYRERERGGPILLLSVISILEDVKSTLSLYLGSMVHCTVIDQARGFLRS